MISNQFKLALSLGLLAFGVVTLPSTLIASEQDMIESYQEVAFLVAKPVSRARGEVEIKKLRQLVAEKKIDADNLMQALQALRDIR